VGAVVFEACVIRIDDGVPGAVEGDGGAMLDVGDEGGGLLREACGGRHQQHQRKDLCGHNRGERIYQESASGGKLILRHHDFPTLPRAGFLSNHDFDVLI